MKRNVLCAVMGFAMLLVGCIPTLHPLYTEKDLVFEPGLVGLWAEDNSRENWRFVADGEKSYKLTYTDSDGKKGEFKAHLVKLGQTRFLDLFPDEEGIKASGRNDYYNFHYVPVHTFLQVHEISPTLQMSVMEVGWVEELLKKEPRAIQHEQMGNRFVVTAGTKELQTFVLRHIRSEGAWGKPSRLIRQDETLKR